MLHTILSENQKKRIDRPLWMLVCFAMFSFWQMGFIYYIGPSLTIDGKTPLPIDMDNATVLIALCYVLSILWMILWPHTVVLTQRIATGIALAAAAGLFLPLSEPLLRLLIYVQIFCCCLMIGFETFIMVNYFSERTNIRHLTAAYSVAVLLIAFIQNEFLPIPFPVFRFIMTGAIVLLLLFFFLMPTGKEIQPRYIKKSDGIVAPKKMLFGTYVLVFVAALMGVSGPAVVCEVTHGISTVYLTDGLCSLCIYALHKRSNLHPFRLIPFLMGLGGIGFLLMFAATQVPALSYLACALIGIGILPCQLLPLYGAVMMKSYPSRSISPTIIALSLGAVLVQGSMVEAFRSAPSMLYLVYAIITAVLVFVYMQVEPFFLFTLRRRITDDDSAAPAPQSAEEHDAADLPPQPADAEADTTAAVPSENLLSVLSKKEREIAELICLGYTNADIAKVLFISEQTVKTHTKKIYPKLDVHSKLELAALVGNYRSSQKE